jgi:hypothetical protein
LLGTAITATDPPAPLALVYWVSAARVAIVPVKQPRDKPANQVGDDKHDRNRGYCQNDWERILHLIYEYNDRRGPGWQWETLAEFPNVGPGRSNCHYLVAL